VNVLVTGAGGFLGRYIAEMLLAQGDRVRGLGSQPHPEMESLGVEMVCADLGNSESVAAACRGMDVVFHTAGIAGLGGRWKDYFQINTLGTRHIVEGCRRFGVRRLVFTSSPSVIFNGEDQRGVDESAPYPCRWLCYYAHSKALAEQMVLGANGIDGLSTCALRPHLIWGPRDRSLVPRILDRARRGKLIIVGDQTNQADITYVENAATAHLQAADALAAESPVAGRAYFISQGEPVNCWGWMGELLAMAGIPPLKKTMSFKAAWRWGWGFEAVYRLFGLRGEPLMTRFLAAQLARSHYFSIARAKADFGYQPAVSTAEGMRRLAAEIGNSKRVMKM